MKADCTLTSLKRSLSHLYKLILQATCPTQTGTWCHRVRGQPELENLNKNQIRLQPSAKSWSHQSNITTYKQHRRCLMGDQFLLCTLHLKHTRYDVVNPMYSNNAREPTTALEMRKRGVHSGVFQCLQLGGYMG